MPIKITSILLITCLILSCTNKKKIYEFSSKEDYLKYINNLDANSRKTNLINTSNKLEDLLKEADDYEIYFSFSMGISLDKDSKKSEYINLDSLNIKEDLYILSNKN